MQRQVTHINNCFYLFQNLSRTFVIERAFALQVRPYFTIGNKLRTPSLEFIPTHEITKSLEKLDSCGRDKIASAQIAYLMISALTSINSHIIGFTPRVGKV